MKALDYFLEISKIPRESGNLDGIRQYLVKWANDNNFENVVDKTGNVIIYCPATKGYEDVPPVLLQGHMDMVCVKTPETVHDFTKDPIDVYQDGDWLKARGTSLGGDNGIAIAMTMAIFTDGEAVHGPLEAMFTVDEETGLTGAFGFDETLIQSRKLINMDSEEEGIIYIGCAGGTDLSASCNVEYEKVPDDWEPVEIKLGGLLGGHSGGEIHMQRLNAISALARMLTSVRQTGRQFMLCSFDGGTRRNVIPSSVSCKICIPSAYKKEIMQRILKTAAMIKEEYRYQDPDFKEEHHCSKCNPSITKPEKALAPECSMKLMTALLAVPHGVLLTSNAVKGVVETSDNLAIAKLEGERFNVEISVRSLIDSAKSGLVSRIFAILEAFGFECEITSGYPSWAPNPNSPLASFCAQAWTEMFEKRPVITSIHAGLECGIIISKIPGMDSVSIGPDLFNVHSVNEKLSVSSVERIYGFVKHLLSIIK